MNRKIKGKEILSLSQHKALSQKMQPIDSDIVYTRLNHNVFDVDKLFVVCIDKLSMNE